MTIVRRLPNSNTTIQLALNNANDAHNTPPGGVDVLSAATTARVVAATPIYNAAMQASAVAKANLNTHTPVKDLAVNKTRKFSSHFIQVFNLGVDREEYLAGNRSFYTLPADSDAVPDLRSEDNVKLWAHRIVNGDADRLAAGGLPMTNPDASQVAARLSTMETETSAQDNFIFLLDQKQEIVNALNTDAGSLIKRVWDEVETFFGEELPASKRANARLWGVIYVTEGPPAVLTGLVKNSAGIALPGVSIELNESTASATTNSEGRYILETTILGNVTLKAKGTPSPSEPTPPVGSIIVNIPDHTTGIDINVADIVVA